jgi:hypothetical protein
MRKRERPSPVVGFRLAVRLRKLVGAVWLVCVAIFLPAHLVVLAATAATFADLPARDLPTGDELLIMVELIRPVVVPLAIALISGLLAFVAWAELWHGGTVRWWMGAGAARVRLAEILGHGVVWWWRYFRLAMMAFLAAASALFAIWAPIRIAISGSGALAAGRGAALLLLAGVVLSLFVILVDWLATLRASWMLGESGRRSAVVAWFRGLAATARQPLRTLLPVVVWGVPGLVMLVLPFLVEASIAMVAMPLCWLVAAFCWVALFVSYAPQNPPEEWVRKMQARAASRVATPAETPDTYRTGRIPIQPPKDR